MDNNFKAKFVFSKTELKGIQTLIVCCFISVLTPIIVNYILAYSKLYRNELGKNTSNEIVDFDIKHQTWTISKTQTIAAKPVLFSFNPNVLSKDDALKLGFPMKAFNNLRKYLSKGGKIINKNQLKKIYGMDTSSYLRLEPYILLPDSIPLKTNIKAQEKRLKLFDINIIEPRDLIYKMCVDYKLSYRIINYRQALGGYVELSQLTEVFGMQDSIYERLKSHLIIEKKIVPRSLQNFTLDSLAKHPYIKYKLAKRICNYRKEHDGIVHISELKHLVSDSLQLQKIKMYFY